MIQQLRLARPVSDLARSQDLYCRGLGLVRLGDFQNHQGFDGVMLSLPGASWHLEFTHCRHQPITPSPTPEDLLVLYLEDFSHWQSRCASLEQAGFAPIDAFNPHWQVRGRTFVDHDGYRVVLQNAGWPQT